VLALKVFRALIKEDEKIQLTDLPTGIIQNKLLNHLKQDKS
jgi:hypothetical protein